MEIFYNAQTKECALSKKEEECRIIISDVVDGKSISNEYLVDGHRVSRYSYPNAVLIGDNYVVPNYIETNTDTFELDNTSYTILTNLLEQIKINIKDRVVNLKCVANMLNKYYKAS